MLDPIRETMLGSLEWGGLACGRSAREFEVRGTNVCCLHVEVVDTNTELN